jgi:hypothetical protein
MTKNMASFIFMASSDIKPAVWTANYRRKTKRPSNPVKFGANSGENEKATLWLVRIERDR